MSAKRDNCQDAYKKVFEERAADSDKPGVLSICLFEALFSDRKYNKRGESGLNLDC
jgi:hypothetical protein